MINARNIVAEVRKRFPNFVITREIENSPTVLFGFLADHIFQAIKINDEITINHAINFVDELVSSNDDVVSACLTEIALGLYYAEQASFQKFRNKLNGPSKNCFDENVRLWRSQGRK
jgi:hypothetical protein